MKRSRPYRASCVPVSPGPPEPLLALLDDVDVTVGHLLAGAAAVASLTVALGTRKDDSAKFANRDLGAARAALVSTTRRAAFCSRRLVRMTAKRVDATTELLTVTVKQLRAWASLALAQEGWWGVSAGCSLVGLHLRAPAPALAAVRTDIVRCVSEVGSASTVVTGDGLRVVSASGPGLTWFEPHSRNEFSMVLAHADGSVPVWLRIDDVAASCSASAAPSRVAGSKAQCPLSVAYEVSLDDAVQVMLQLTVCSCIVALPSDENGCGVRVLRRPSVAHKCAAAGTHIRTLAVMDGLKCGMAVRADEKWMVVGLYRTLSVHTLPWGVLERSCGSRGDGPLQFNGLRRLCIAPNGNIIVVDSSNKRLQEVTKGCVFVRFIELGKSGDGKPYCVAVCADVIAVGCAGGTGSRVMLLDFGTGIVSSQFGEVGTAVGQLSPLCTGIQFTPDGNHVMIAEDCAKRLSIFTTAGMFERCVGVGVLGGGSMDVLQSVSGEYVVADYYNHRVCVFSPDGSELVRSWGTKGGGAGKFQSPTALAAVGKHLYVMDLSSGRVQVFE